MTTAQLTKKYNLQWKIYKNDDNEYITVYKGVATFGNTLEELEQKFIRIDQRKQYEVYKNCVLEMIEDGESLMYIKIYINDLMRDDYITFEQCEELHGIMIDAIGGNGIETLTTIAE